MTIQELQNIFLSTQKITAIDFFVLLITVTKKEKAYLFAHPEYILTKEEEEKIYSVFLRRMNHEPVAYIIGEKEFYGYKFSVTKDTLIPRPETEILVELVLHYVKTLSQKSKLFDIGTGSGNIIISLAKEITKGRKKLSGFSFFGGDISETAIAVAKKNARCHKVDTLIQFYTGSLLSPFTKELLTGDEIIITANLPYLSSKIYEDASCDVKEFEPKTALISGELGLDHYYNLLTELKKIQRNATLFLEISPEQRATLEEKVLFSFPQAKIEFYKDLAGKDRIAVLHIQ